MTVSQVPDTSTTLLRDMADSSHARWSVFYSRYQPMMRSYLQARFPSLDADDIVQETFVALAKILPDYKYAPEKNGAFHNFLTGVLRNKALCALDASRRQMAIEERMQLAISVNGKSEHEQSYRDWRENLFEVALQQLLSDESIHDRTKQAFIRTAINGESIEAVADSLGVQRNTVDCMRSRTFHLQHHPPQGKIHKGRKMNTSKYISLSELDLPTAVIKVNRLYRHGMTAEELSDITRGYWRTSHIKAQKCDVVLSVYHGEVMEVYTVDEWVDGAKLRLATRQVNDYRGGSYGFNGHVAPNAIRDKFIGRFVNKLYKRGDRNPVRAFNVI